MYRLRVLSKRIVLLIIGYRMKEDFFIRYFKGQLSQEEERQLLDWLEKDQENRDFFSRERKLWDLLMLNPDEPSLKKINQRKPVEKENNTSMKWLMELIKVAAVFIIGFYLATLLPWGKSDKRDLQVKENTIEVPIGQRVCITLADGTKVWLNAMSRFTFPDKFSENTREVKLDGEALFEVAHNPDVPFIVKTSKHDIRALGTKFNVYAYSNNPNMETVLINGKVIINEQGNEKTQYELFPKHMIIFGDKERPKISSIVDTNEYTDWIDGTYIFDDQLFSSIIQRLERYYEVNIMVKNEKLLNHRFTGKFRHSDPITVILDVIKMNQAFKYTVKGSNIVID
jgi:ferric-dicitrate binding protein FerR (iron transport regulator)